MVNDKKQINSSQKVLVSICCLAYNHELYIRECLDGFLLQKTDFSFEILIHDDASTDDTAKIIKEYEFKYPDIIKPIYQLENQYSKGQGGISIKYNFSRAKGKYIAMCEGDDYWTDPLKLQKQVDFLEANLDYVLCFHAVKILNIKGDIVDDFITKIPENHETIQTLALLGNYIHTPSVVFRNIIKEFPFEMEHSTIGDYFLYMILAEHGKLKYMEEKMGVYRFGVGIFSTSSELQRTKSNLKLFISLVSYLENDEIKKIIFKRQLQAFSRLEKIIANDYFYNYASRNSVVRAIKFILPNFRRSLKE